jgi:hypothetical protein
VYHGASLHHISSTSAILVSTFRGQCLSTLQPSVVECAEFAFIGGAPHILLGTYANGLRAWRLPGGPSPVLERKRQLFKRVDGVEQAAADLGIE